MSFAKRIKPSHIELILKIAETEQLKLAAPAVGISQPAASRILSELEEVLDSILFHRHPTGMQLTPEGEIFVRHARVVMLELGNITEELGQMRSGAIGSVRIGAVSGPALGCLMPAVKSVLAKYPDADISVDVGPSSQLFRGLEEARYDFILGRPPQTDLPYDFQFIPGRGERVSLLVHRTHPMSRHKEVSLKDLSGFSWVIQGESSPIRQAVETAFLSDRVEPPSKVLNSSSLLVALAYVSDGHAIAPVSEEVRHLLLSNEINTNLIALPLNEPIQVAPYFAILDRRRKPTRLAENLFNEVKSRL